MVSEFLALLTASAAVLVAAGLVFWGLAGVAAARRRGRPLAVGALVGALLPVVGVGILLASRRGPDVVAAPARELDPVPVPPSLRGRLASGLAPAARSARGAAARALGGGGGRLTRTAPPLPTVSLPTVPPSRRPPAFGRPPTAAGAAPALAAAPSWSLPGDRRAPLAPLAVPVPRQPSLPPVGAPPRQRRARPPLLDLALFGLAVVAVVLLAAVSTAPLVSFGVSRLVSESVGLGTRSGTAGPLAAGLLVLTAAALLQLWRPRGTWPVLGAFVSVSALVVGLQAVLVTDTVGDLLRGSGGPVARYGDVSIGDGAWLLVAAGVAGTCWAALELVLVGRRCRR